MDTIEDFPFETKINTTSDSSAPNSRKTFDDSSINQLKLNRMALQ
ncbi:MAG: hypothetical protein WC806_00720 [Candidatus Gracilibacteria bacterium]|jgi:hypothetical protein